MFSTSAQRMSGALFHILCV